MKYAVAATLVAPAALVAEGSMIIA